MGNKMKTKVLSLCVLFSMVSCAHPPMKSFVGFTINSITDSSAKFAKSYVILPKDGNANVNDLFFKEYSMYVERSLKQLGYEKVKSKPAIAILIDYGVGDPKSTTSIFSSSKTEVSKDYFPNLAVANTSTSTFIATDTTYPKYLRVTAVDFKTVKSSNPVSFWDTITVSHGHNTDLRAEMPFLVFGGYSYFGKDTSIELRIAKEFDPRQKAFRQIIGDERPATYLPQDLVLVSEECKTLISRSGKCETIKGLKISNSNIKLSNAAIYNSSPVAWTNPQLSITCYTNTVENPSSNSSAPATTHKHEIFEQMTKSVNLEINPGETVNFKLDTDLTRAPASESGNQKCDLKIESATELNK